MNGTRIERRAIMAIAVGLVIFALVQVAMAVGGLWMALGL